MTKREIDSLISDMKKGGAITKAAPWMIEGSDENLIDVRYVALQPKEWEEIFDPSNNLMVKFTHTRNDSRAEFVVANNAPFFKYWTARIDSNTKWEQLIGNMKLKLKKDKEDVKHHKDKAGNLYKLVLPHLK